MSLKIGTNDISSATPGSIRLGANSLDKIYDGTKLVWERGNKFVDELNTLNDFTQTKTGSGVSITSGVARWSGTSDGSSILLYNQQALTNNQYISAVVANPNSFGSAIIFHCDATYTGYYAGGVVSNKLAIVRTSGRWSQNSATTYAEVSTTVVAGDLLELWNVGNVFFMALNGTVRLTHTMASPIIDASHRYQGFGMYRASFSNSSHIDRWSGGDAGAWGKI